MPGQDIFISYSREDEPITRRFASAFKQEGLSVWWDDAIRSGEIPRLLRDRFATVVERRVGGTLQHVLYNGIMQNFTDDDAEACACVERTWQLEDALVDSGLLPSDFLVTIGRRR